MRPPGRLPDDLIDVDLDAIESEGGPVSDGVIRIENADYLARPLRLSPTEASAVMVALHTLRDVSPRDTQAIIDAVAGQARGGGEHGGCVTPDRGGRPVRRGGADRDVRHPPAGGRRTATGAVDLPRPARDELSERVVDPHGVVPHGRFHYLDAWCHIADGDRLFRLDRITEAAVLDSPIATEARPPREVDEGLLSGEAPPGGTVATLVLQPKARLGAALLPDAGGPPAAPTASSRSTCRWPTRAG